MARPRSGANAEPLAQQRYVNQVLVPCHHDPLLWAKLAYPWGQKGHKLEERDLSPWQEELFGHIGEQLRLMKSGKIPRLPVRASCKTGHGPGKSAAASMLSDWARSTMVDTRVLITANTDTQLKDKTMPEVRKWHNMSLSKNFFTATATSVHSNEKDKVKSWIVSAIPWSEENPEAFAGLHNEGSRILIIFDEASSIPRIIWETVEGAMTDLDCEIIWVAMGNPTRNSGYFYETFGLRQDDWYNITVDTRNVPTCNQLQIQKWQDMEGEDSDFFRIRVRGEFPKASASQFISTDWVTEAQHRSPIESHPERGGWEEPLICGIDLARSGVCKNVMTWRRGRDAQSIPPDVFSDMPNTTDFVVKCAMRLNDMKPDIIVMDGDGLGGPIIDRLADDYGFNIVEARGNHRSPEPDRYKNMRVYMWSKMKEWLHHKGCIYSKDEAGKALLRELTTIETVNAGQAALVQLESKKQLTSRGEPSPDHGDSLALTFHPEAIEAQPSVSREYRANMGSNKCRTEDDLMPEIQQTSGILSREEADYYRRRANPRR